MSKWLEYTTWNQRDEKMAKLWATGAAKWITHNIKNKQSKKLFDYGCSYFDLGEALTGEFHEVYGHDPDEFAIKRARLKQIPNAIFISDLNEVKDASFDIIVVSSVLQYFEGIEEVERFFQFASRKLKSHNETLLLIADVIPQNYSPWKDAVENFLFSIETGVMMPMLKHLLKAAFRNSNLKLLRINKEQMSSIAQANGFSIRYLENNLTPSKRRYSCVCILR